MPLAAEQVVIFKRQCVYPDLGGSPMLLGMPEECGGGAGAWCGLQVPRCFSVQEFGREVV